MEYIAYIPETPSYFGTWTILEIIFSLLLKSVLALHDIFI
jgi:hypothetical protein